MLLNTIKNNINLVLKKGIITPFLFALAVLFFILLIYYIKNKTLNIISNKKLLCFAFLTAFFLSFAVQLTLVVRAGQEHDPLSKLFSGWLIVKQTYVYDLSPIGNLILLMPFSLSLNLLFDNVSSYRPSKRIIFTTVSAFLISLFIETAQLIFKIGTFQISDLVYNSFGGLIIVLVYIRITNLKYNKKKASRKK